MTETDALYKVLLSSRTARKQVRLMIAGAIYGEDRIVSLRTYGGLFKNGTFGIGNALAREIDLTLYNPGNIPHAAQISPYVRLTDGTRASEWIQKGVFYINSRVPDTKLNTLKIHGFDGMLKGDVIWTPGRNLAFPMSQRAAALEIARLLGVTLDNPDDIRDDYQWDGNNVPVGYYIDYPANNYTARNILEFIAGANGGNFVMTDAGSLRLIRPFAHPTVPTNGYLVDENGNAITLGGTRILI